MTYQQINKNITQIMDPRMLSQMRNWQLKQDQLKKDASFSSQFRRVLQKEDKDVIMERATDEEYDGSWSIYSFSRLYVRASPVYVSVMSERKVRACGSVFTKTEEAEVRSESCLTITKREPIRVVVRPRVVRAKASVVTTKQLQLATVKRGIWNDLVSKPSMQRRKMTVALDGTCSIKVRLVTDKGILSNDRRLLLRGKYVELEEDTGGRRDVNQQTIIRHDGKKAFFAVGETRQGGVLHPSSESMISYICPLAGTGESRDTKRALFMEWGGFRHGTYIGPSAFLVQHTNFFEEPMGYRAVFVMSGHQKVFPKVDDEVLMPMVVRWLDLIASNHIRASMGVSVVNYLCNCDPVPLLRTFEYWKEGRFIKFLDIEGDGGPDDWGHAILRVEGGMGMIAYWASGESTFRPGDVVFAKGKTREARYCPELIFQEFDYVLPWEKEPRQHSPLGGVLQMAVRAYAFMMGVPHLKMSYRGHMASWCANSRNGLLSAAFFCLYPSDVISVLLRWGSKGDCKKLEDFPASLRNLLGSDHEISPAPVACLRSTSQGVYSPFN